MATVTSSSVPGMSQRGGNGRWENNVAAESEILETMTSQALMVRLPGFRGLIGAAFLILSFSSEVFAQEPSAVRDSVRINPPQPTSIDSAGIRSGEIIPGLRPRGPVTVVAGHPELMLADRFINEGHCDEALQILKPLWENQPPQLRDEAVASSLKRAYRCLKDYRGLLDVLGQQLRGRPDDPIWLSEEADAYFDMDKPDSARMILVRLVAVAPKDRERHQAAAEAYIRAGQTNDGIAAYRKARVVLGDSAVFAEDLARVFEARREYTAAVEEYFRWLNASPQSKQAVQVHITNLVKLPEAAPQITVALQRIVKESPRHEYAHRLYADLLFESGRVDSAFAEYRRADRLSGQPGAHRLYGVERALETGRNQTARDEAVSFLRDYPGHPQATQVHLDWARAELALGHPLVAVNMLKELAAQFPHPGERAHVEYEIGNIYRLYVGQMDSAKAYFEHVIAFPLHTQERTAAWIRLGDIEEFYGHLGAADSAYQKAGGEGPSLDQREEIAFRRAEIAMFSASFEDCDQRLRDLVKQFPRGMYVNDALELSAIIKDGSDAGAWSLSRYAAGLYALRRHLSDSATAWFGQLATDSANALADESAFMIGQIETTDSQFAQAAATYRGIIKRFAGSFLIPRAWMRLGELYAGPLADPAQARLAYQTILSDFKDSPLVEEARRRLQNLPSP